MAGHEHRRACGVPTQAVEGRPARILAFASAVDLGMFALEVAVAAHSGSLSLLAQSVDFLGDAAYFGLSPLVRGRSLRSRNRIAFGKGFVMTTWGLVILLRTLPTLAAAHPPEAFSMGWVGALALAVKLSVSWLVQDSGPGETARRIAWPCARDEVLGSFAVLLAAGLVAWTGRTWPDILMAFLMAVLGLSSGSSIMRQAGAEHPEPSSHGDRPS
jgi:Co/Zn/Cd efflux system component